MHGHPVAGAMPVERSRVRRRPTDFSGSRIGFVVADEVQRQRASVGLLQNDVRAERDTFARSQWRFDYAGRLDTRLQVFGLALVTRGTRSGERRT
jgi:hypothetical protein